MLSVKLPVDAMLPKSLVQSGISTGQKRVQTKHGLKKMKSKTAHLTSAAAAAAADDAAVATAQVPNTVQRETR